VPAAAPVAPAAPENAAAAVPRKRQTEAGPIRTPLGGRRPSQPVLFGTVAAAALLLAGGWYVTRSAPSDPPAIEVAPVAAPSPVTAPTSAPTPAPTPAPVVAPTEVPPGSVADPAAAAVAPPGAPPSVPPASPPTAPPVAPAAPAPVVQAAAPAPAPVAKVPAPAPAPVAKAPVPAPVAAPAPTAAGSGAAPVVGAWNGYLNTSGEALAMTLSGPGTGLSGTVSAKFGGVTKTITIGGTLDPTTGTLSLSGPNFTFQGVFAGSSAKGTCSVSGTAEKCSLRR
jgi:hypothetical protein